MADSSGVDFLEDQEVWNTEGAENDPAFGESSKEESAALKWKEGLPSSDAEDETKKDDDTEPESSASESSSSSESEDESDEESEDEDSDDEDSKKKKKKGKKAKKEAPAKKEKKRAVEEEEPASKKKAKTAKVTGIIKMKDQPKKLKHDTMFVSTTADLEDKEKEKAAVEKKSEKTKEKAKEKTKKEKPKKEEEEKKAKKGTKRKDKDEEIDEEDASEEEEEKDEEKKPKKKRAKRPTVCICCGKEQDSHKELNKIHKCLSRDHATCLTCQKNPKNVLCKGKLDSGAVCGAYLSPSGIKLMKAASGKDQLPSKEDAVKWFKEQAEKAAAPKSAPAAATPKETVIASGVAAPPVGEIKTSCSYCKASLNVGPNGMAKHFKDKHGMVLTTMKMNYHDATQTWFFWDGR
jgi:hypothetical protein